MTRHHLWYREFRKAKHHLHQRLSPRLLLAELHRRKAEKLQASTKQRSAPFRQNEQTGEAQVAQGAAMSLSTLLAVPPNVAGDEGDSPEKTTSAIPGYSDSKYRATFGE